MAGSNYTVATASQIAGRCSAIYCKGRDTEAAETNAADIPSQSLTRRDSKRENPSSQVTEIYFSPIDISFSRAELSDPLPTPPLTPTQDSYDAAHKAAVTSPLSRDIPGSGRRKFRLSHEQLDRLLAAFVSSPMLQEQMQTESTDSTIALPSPSNAANVRSATRAALEKQSPRKLPCSPKAGKTPQVRLGGMALIDPKTRGSPACFFSKHYHQRTDVLRVGERFYLNLPYGKGAGCYLRVEPQSMSSNSRVIMQIVNQVLERKTGKMIYFFVVELDVTESFTKAALTELTGQAGIRLDDIEVTSVIEKVRDGSSEGVDWLALADELEATCEIKDVVEKTVDSFASLDKETCIMQTLTLLSELERVKRKHQDFVVVRSHAEYGNGVPSRMSVPWISQHLESKSIDGGSISSDSMQKFRQELIGIVAKHCLQNDPFTATSGLAGEEKRVVFMPLVEGTTDKNVAWVCFFRNDSDL